METILIRLSPKEIQDEVRRRHTDRINPRNFPPRLQKVFNFVIGVIVVDLINILADILVILVDKLARELARFPFDFQILMVVFSWKFSLSSSE